MKLLLDTNALVWLLDKADGGSLGIHVRDHLQQAEVVYASSISVVEIRIKSMLGRLKSQPDLLADIAKAGCLPLSLSDVDADTIVDFPVLKRHDPFDRMLLAQASAQGLTLLTSDKVLLNLNLSFVVDARK